MKVEQVGAVLAIKAGMEACFQIKAFINTCSCGTEEIECGHKGSVARWFLVTKPELQEDLPFMLVLRRNMSGGIGGSFENITTDGASTAEECKSFLLLTALAERAMRAEITETLTLPPLKMQDRK
jgi:hypothetical protein